MNISNLPFSEEDLEQHVEGGWVTRRKHPELDLWIYNYGPQTQYQQHWDDVTINCRGLILDADCNIIARPFQKIFNYGEYIQNGWDIPFNREGFWAVQTKFDGSLGIGFRVNGEWQIATRGSFESDQAKWATQWWKDNIGDIYLQEGYTPLFEIIYPENRICVDYGDRAELVLLAVIDNESGADVLGWEEWPGALAEIRLWAAPDDIAEQMNFNPQENEEGVVLINYGKPSLRIKVKYDEYVRLHGIIHSFSEKRVWEVLSEGGDFLALLDNVPDEFYTQVKNVVQSLHGQYAMIEGDCLHWFDVAKNLSSNKKEFAERVSKHTYKAILFKMYDQKPYEELIWKMLKPKGE